MTTPADEHSPGAERSATNRACLSETTKPRDQTVSVAVAGKIVGVGAVEMLPQLEAEAKKRVGGRPTAGSEKPSVKSREVSSSVAAAGRIVGVGESIVQRAKKVKQEDPALFEQIKRVST